MASDHCTSSTRLAQISAKSGFASFGSLVLDGGHFTRTSQPAEFLDINQVLQLR